MVMIRTGIFYKIYKFWVLYFLIILDINDFYEFFTPKNSIIFFFFIQLELKNEINKLFRKKLMVDIGCIRKIEKVTLWI